MARLDLDAARAARDAARAEARAEPHELILGGETFELPPELPAEFAFLLADNEIKAAISELLGPEDFARFWALRPSMDDVMEVGVNIAGLYGISVGEARASGGSSSNGSSRPRPTSNGTTGSTSERSSGDRAAKASAGSERS